MITNRPNFRNARPFVAFLAAGVPLLGAATLTLTTPRPAVAAAEDAPEPAATSRLTGVELPAGAFRLTDAGAVGEMTAQLKKVATEGGFTLSRVESLIWGGKEHSQDRNKAVKGALEQALKQGGYNYQTAGEKNTDDGLVTFFVAGKQGARQAALGFFVASDSYLVLTWGEVAPKGAAADAPTSKPAPQAPAAKASSPAEQKKLDAALGTAIEGRKADEVSALLAKGANPNTRTDGEYRQSYLLRGVITGGREVVAALLKAGADPNLGSDKEPPLFIASLLGQADVVTLLLDAGADVNAAGAESGMTALHAASITGKEEATKLLLERGADASRRDKSGKTPRQIAEQSKHTAVIELLRAAEKE